MLCLLVQNLILELSAHFHLEGSGDFASGYKFLIFWGGSSDEQMCLALIMKDSMQGMGTEEILELSSQKIPIQLSIQSVEIKIL